MVIQNIVNNSSAVIALPNASFDRIQPTFELFASQNDPQGNKPVNRGLSKLGFLGNISYLAQMPNFVKEHFIAITATVAGLARGGFIGMQAKQARFPIAMVVAPALLHGNRAFIATAATLAVGKALLASYTTSGSSGKRTYFSQIADFVKEYPYITTVSTVAGLVGAVIGYEAFVQWGLPSRVVRETTLGVGAITTLGTAATLTGISAIIEGVAGSENALYKFGSWAGTSVQNSWNHGYLSSMANLWANNPIALNSFNFPVLAETSRVARKVTFHLLDAYLETTLGIISVATLILEGFKTSVLYARTQVAYINPDHPNETAQPE